MLAKLPFSLASASTTFSLCAEKWPVSKFAFTFGRSTCSITRRRQATQQKTSPTLRSLSRLVLHRDASRGPGCFSLGIQGATVSRTQPFHLQKAESGFADLWQRFQHIGYCVRISMSEDDVEIGDADFHRRCQRRSLHCV